MTKPTVAITPSTMIWRTANSTEVNSRHRARPSFAGAFSRAERDGRARSTAVVAMTVS
jgi:hypothetical protein